MRVCRTNTGTCPGLLCNFLQLELQLKRNKSGGGGGVWLNVWCWFSICYNFLPFMLGQLYCMVGHFFFILMGHHHEAWSIEPVLGEVFPTFELVSSDGSTGIVIWKQEEKHIVWRLSYDLLFLFSYDWHISYDFIWLLLILKQEYTSCFLNDFFSYDFLTLNHMLSQYTLHVVR